MPDPILAPLTTIPADLQTLPDYQIEAQKHLNAATWSYLNGGAMHEISVQQNILQFQDIQLIPRHLNDLTHGNTQIHLFGQIFPHPIFWHRLVINNFFIHRVKLQQHWQQKLYRQIMF